MMDVLPYARISWILNSFPILPCVRWVKRLLDLACYIFDALQSCRFIVYNCTFAVFIN